MAKSIRTRLLESAAPQPQSPSEIPPERVLRDIPGTGHQLGGVSRNTVLRAIARGDLDAVKIGTRTMITDSSIQRFVAGLPRADIRNA